MLNIFNDEYFMKEALKEAQIAMVKDEVPVGAVVVYKDQIIGRGHNQTETLNDVTAHAEIIALGAAANSLGSKYLDNCVLYVTLEPCTMCAGAMYWARPARLVFGAEDEKRGFMKYGKDLLHPKTKLELGVLKEECSAILQYFFQMKRT